jgi:hypothetical protein
MEITEKFQSYILSTPTSNTGSNPLQLYMFQYFTPDILVDLAQVQNIFLIGTHFPRTAIFDSHHAHKLKGHF